tara:strand:+ start:623 stop:1378 length:756 start_codon:yes stop_codon:yes gene_type:complete
MAKIKVSSEKLRKAKQYMAKGYIDNVLVSKLMRKYKISREEAVTVADAASMAALKPTKEQTSQKRPAQKETDTKKSKSPKRICYGSPDYATEGYSWLSSMQSCLIIASVPKKYSQTGRLMFSSLEQAFQWLKSDDKKREVILNCTRPKDARYHGSEKAGAVMRADWSDIKDSVMEALLTAKYTQNVLLGNMLSDTGSAPLFEVAPWDKEGYWGVNKSFEGKNKQAKLTEKVRTRIQKGKAIAKILDLKEWL